MINGEDGFQITITTVTSIEARLEISIKTGLEYSNGTVVSYLAVFGRIGR